MLKKFLDRLWYCRWKGRHDWVTNTGGVNCSRCLTQINVELY